MRSNFPWCTMNSNSGERERDTERERETDRQRENNSQGKFMIKLVDLVFIHYHLICLFSLKEWDILVM